jgi:hypothetical protein
MLSILKTPRTTLRAVRKRLQTRCFGEALVLKEIIARTL